MSDTVMERLGLTNVFAEVNQRLTEASSRGHHRRATRSGAHRRFEPDVATVKVAEQIILPESPFILGSPPAVDGLEAMTEMFGGPA